MDLDAAAPPPSRRPQTSPWIYVGCGCGLLLAIAAVAVLFFVKKVADEGRRMERGMNHPQEREQRTRDLLVYRELPAGYYAAGAFSLPLLFDMAFLSDHPPGDAASGGHGPDFHDHGFIFMKMRLAKLPRDSRARRRILFGTGGRPAWEQGSGFSMGSQEALGDGELTTGGGHVLYRATRGEIHTKRERHQGINAILMIDCPDRHVRFAFWVTRDPAPGQPTATLDKSGTPADPLAITAFLDHFNLCTGGS